MMLWWYAMSRSRHHSMLLSHKCNGWCRYEEDRRGDSLFDIGWFFTAAAFDSTFHSHLYWVTGPLEKRQRTQEFAWWWTFWNLRLDTLGFPVSHTSGLKHCLQHGSYPDGSSVQHNRSLKHSINKRKFKYKSKKTVKITCCGTIKKWTMNNIIIDLHNFIWVT